jgi:hypothetical protein
MPYFDQFTLKSLLTSFFKFQEPLQLNLINNDLLASCNYKGVNAHF